MTDILAFEAAVNQLVDLGYSRPEAEQAVRKQHPQLAPTFPLNGERDERALERAEQIEVRKLFCAFGFTVRNLSQYRPSHVAPGFPDLFVTHNRERIAFFFETKRQVGGKRSPAQVEFAADCNRCGVPCYHGDRYSAAQLLVDLGLAIRVDDRIEPAERYVRSEGAG